MKNKCGVTRRKERREGRRSEEVGKSYLKRLERRLSLVKS